MIAHREIQYRWMRIKQKLIHKISSLCQTNVTDSVWFSIICNKNFPIKTQSSPGQTNCFNRIAWPWPTVSATTLSTVPQVRGRSPVPSTCFNHWFSTSRQITETSPLSVASTSFCLLMDTHRKSDMALHSAATTGTTCSRRTASVGVLSSWVKSPSDKGPSWNSGPRLDMSLSTAMGPQALRTASNTTVSSRRWPPVPLSLLSHWCRASLQQVLAWFLLSLRMTSSRSEVMPR